MSQQSGGLRRIVSRKRHLKPSAKGATLLGLSEPSTTGPGRCRGSQGVGFVHEPDYPRVSKFGWPRSEPDGRSCCRAFFHRASEEKPREACPRFCIHLVLTELKVWGQARERVVGVEEPRRHPFQRRGLKAEFGQPFLRAGRS